MASFNFSKNETAVMQYKSNATAELGGFHLLHGPPGSGKSHALVWVMNAVRERDYFEWQSRMTDLILTPSSL